MKEMGVTLILATTACGSLTEEFKRGMLVVLDNYIDMTKYRPNTFYDGQESHPKGVMHISMHPPYNIELRQLLIESCKEIEDIQYKEKSTIVVIEGPNFSSYAENKVYSSWGCTTIGMTNAPEVILAKELGMPYAALAIITDDICYKENGVVDPNEVITIFKATFPKACEVLRLTIKKIGEKDWSECLEKLRKITDEAIMKH